MSHQESTLEYFFVPMGREKGGYLDVLQLPPHAVETEVQRKETAFRLDADQVFRDGRKELRPLLKSEEITKEEFGARVEKLKAEKEQKLADLNELKTKYDAAQGDRRRQATRGAVSDDTIWFEPYRRDAPESEQFWETLLAPRVIPQIAGERLKLFRLRLRQARRNSTRKSTRRSSREPGSLTESK